MKGLVIKPSIIKNVHQMFNKEDQKIGVVIFRNKTMDEQRRTMRLFAASHRLLVACKKALKFVEKKSGGKGKLVKRLRKAIDKVEVDDA